MLSTQQIDLVITAIKYFYEGEDTTVDLDTLIEETVRKLESMRALAALDQVQNVDVEALKREVMDSIGCGRDQNAKGWSKGYDDGASDMFDELVASGHLQTPVPQLVYVVLSDDMAHVFSTEEKAIAYADTRECAVVYDYLIDSPERATEVKQ